MSQKARSRKILVYKAIIGGFIILIIAATISCLFITGADNSKMSGECATSDVVTTTNSTEVMHGVLMRMAGIPKDIKVTIPESALRMTTTSAKNISTAKQTTLSEEKTTTAEISTTEIKTTTTTTTMETTKETTKTTTTVTTIPLETTIEVTTTVTDEKSEEIPDEVVTLKATGYCKDSCGGNDITASGVTANVWHTIATYDYPAGTKIFIPAFKDKPNGGWFVVEDTGVRGKIDIWMATVSECYAITGYYECHIYY